MLETVAGLSLAERLLLAFCHEPKACPMVHFEPGSELALLCELFPDLGLQIRGKHVIDFGCGHGYQAIALLKAGAAQVTGVEVQASLAEDASQRVAEHGLQDCISIQRKLQYRTADIIISQNSFEHFTAPAATLAELKQALAPEGRIYVTFGPLWYSPAGSHMGYFCRLPWVNLLFSESTILAVRNQFRQDHAATYAEAGLGQLTLRRFELLVKQAGLRIEWKRYDAVKKMRFLRSVPILRELFINRVSCILSSDA